MSFGKAKRFSYSIELEEKSDNKSRWKERSDSTNTDEGKMSTKYTIYIPPDSMPVHSPIKCNQNRRRIHTKLYHRNSFNDSEYFVDEKGNITQESNDSSEKTPTPPPDYEVSTLIKYDDSPNFLTFDEFQSSLQGLRKDLEDKPSEDDVAVGRMVDEVLDKIRAEGEEKIRGFVEGFAEWNVAMVKEIKDKIKSLIKDVKPTSKDEVKELTSMLLRRLEEVETSNGVHEERLKTIDDKIERQAVVINALATVIQSLQQWLKHN